MSSALRPLVAVGCLFVLQGCEMLPRSGPAHEDVARSATSVLGASATAVTAPAVNYVAIDLSENALRFLDRHTRTSLSASFAGDRRAAPQLTIGVGDIVQITIFESSSGGLFVPNDAGSRPGNYVILPNQTVGKSGMLSVPYAGEVRAAGRRINEIGREIEEKLKNRAIEPQVILTLVSQRSNEVAVVGEVGSPAKIQMNSAGERILDVIARAGGIRWPGHEVYVTLQRGNRKVTVFFPHIVQKPSENIFLVPGDVVYVYREQRFFQAFGATGDVGRFNFDTEKLTLADAVGRAGGLLDNRANPGQVFVYRQEDRDTATRIGADLSAFPVSQSSIPVIYRANFRDPSSFFVAQKFAMRDKDVLYVSNAESVELNKLLAFISAVPNTVGNVADDVNSVVNAGVRVKSR